MIPYSQGDGDMIISDYTTGELEHFRKECNFVCHEMDVFDLRSKGLSLEEIAEILHLSVEGVKKISRKVNNKICRVHF